MIYRGTGFLAVLTSPLQPLLPPLPTASRNVDCGVGSFASHSRNVDGWVGSFASHSRNVDE
jgi:hypothetical protein